MYFIAQESTDDHAYYELSRLWQICKTDSETKTTWIVDRTNGRERKKEPHVSDSNDTVQNEEWSTFLSYNILH